MTQIEIRNAAGDFLQKIEVEAGKNLLQQLEAAGVEIPNACKTGICAACMCSIQQGAEHVDKSARGEPAFPLAEEEVMTCIASVHETDETIILHTLD